MKSGIQDGSGLHEEKQRKRAELLLIRSHGNDRPSQCTLLQYINPPPLPKTHATTIPYPSWRFHDCPFVVFEVDGRSSSLFSSSSELRVSSGAENVVSTKVSSSLSERSMSDVAVPAIRSRILSAVSSLTRGLFPK